MAQTQDRTMWNSMLHIGLNGSFMKFPHVPPDTAALKKAGARAAIYGIPWDSTSISRTGANYGPRGMRELSCQFLSYNATLGFDIVDELSPVDCGDTDVVLANPEKTFANAQRDISQIIGADALPMTMGGDHSILIPAVRAVKEHYDNPGLVLVDTHLDTAHDVGGELLNHCCPIVRAVEAGFDPAHISLVAINGWQNPRSELDYCLEHGIDVVWIEDIWAKGIGHAVERALKVAGNGTDGLYLSLDIDALDTSYAVGTCTPTPGGLTAREMIELVRGISTQGLIGVDLVEVAPSLDPSSIATCGTAKLGARLLLDAAAYHAGASYAA